MHRAVKHFNCGGNAVVSKMSFMHEEFFLSFPKVKTTNSSLPLQGGTDANFWFKHGDMAN